MDKKRIGYVVAGLLAVGLVVWLVMPKEKSCAELQREADTLRGQMERTEDPYQKEEYRSKAILKLIEIKSRLEKGDKNCNP